MQSISPPPDMQATQAPGDEIPLRSHRIEVRIRSLAQIFDSRDPSPFLAKDLDPDAEQYIVDSAQEIATRLPLALVLHLSTPPESPQESRDIGEAIREHFTRQSGYADLRLRRLIRRGWISLAIGLAFLSAVLSAAAALLPWAESSTAIGIAREGLLICGWVAMWRPLEIFLFDWWPILGERRVFDRLRHMPVQIVCPDAPAP